LQVRKKSGANPLLEKVEQKFYPIIFHFCKFVLNLRNIAQMFQQDNCNVVHDGFAPLFPKVEKVDVE